MLQYSSDHRDKSQPSPSCSAHPPHHRSPIESSAARPALKASQTSSAARTLSCVVPLRYPGCHGNYLHLQSVNTPPSHSPFPALPPRAHTHTRALQACWHRTSCTAEHRRRDERLCTFIHSLPCSPHAVPSGERPRPSPPDQLCTCARASSERRLLIC